MTTVLLSAAGNILFGFWNEQALGHHNRAIGSPRIASTAYQSWPTKSHSILNRSRFLFLRFWNQRGGFTPPTFSWFPIACLPLVWKRKKKRIFFFPPNWGSGGLCRSLHLRSLRIGLQVIFPQINLPLIRCSTSQKSVRTFFCSCLFLANKIKSHIDSSYPEGNFERNQLLEGSMSLSPLCSAQTNDLHVSNAPGLHHSFPWLCRNQV